MGTKIAPCCKYLQEAAACDPDEILNEIESSNNGLANGEAYARVKKYGINEINLHCSFAHETVFVRAFASGFLITLFTLSLLTSRFSGQAGAYHKISMVMLVLLGIYAVLKLTCRHYEMSMLTHLRQWLQSSLTVTRRYRQIGIYLDEHDEEKRPVQIPRIAQKTVSSKTLVPGDLVHLVQGEVVAADMRLLTSHALFVDQTLFKGTRCIVEKKANWDKQGDPLWGQSNLCLMGTGVVGGNGTGIVLATGNSTYLGAIVSHACSSTGWLLAKGLAQSRLVSALHRAEQRLPSGRKFMIQSGVWLSGVMAAAALFVPFSPLLSYIGLASISLSGLIGVLIAVLYGSIMVQAARLRSIRMLHTAVMLGTRLLQKGIEERGIE